MRFYSPQRWRASFATGRADANPDVRAKQAQAQAIVAQVQALAEDVSAAAERYNGASYRLQQLTGELLTTRSDLRQARSMHHVAQDRLAARLVQLYTSDEPGALEVILGAESPRRGTGRLAIRASRLQLEHLSLLRHH